MALVPTLPIVGGAPTGGTGDVHTISGLIDYFNSTSSDVAFVNFKPGAASAGLTQTRIMSAATNNATNLKAAAGNIHSIRVFNTKGSGLAVLKLYNKASPPTVGTDTPVWTIPLPAGGGFSEWFPVGFYFSTGISYAIVTGIADSDNTSVALNDVVGTINWA